MGAEFWEHTTLFQPNAEAALRSLQAEVYYRAGYDLTRLLANRVADMEQAIRWCEEEDPYDLLGHYRDCLRRFQQLAAAGVPGDPAARVALLREIESISSDSAPGVLALEGVSDEAAERMVHRLSAETLKLNFGTATPGLSELRAGLSRLAESMDRGSAVCFAIDEGGEPISWCFAGYTAD